MELELIVLMFSAVQVLGVKECYSCRGKCGDAMSEELCLTERAYCYRGWANLNAPGWKNPRPVKGCMYEVDTCPEDFFNCTFCYHDLCNRSGAEIFRLDYSTVISILIGSYGLL